MGFLGSDLGTTFVVMELMYACTLYIVAGVFTWSLTDCVSFIEIFLSYFWMFLPETLFSKFCNVMDIFEDLVLGGICTIFCFLFIDFIFSF
jgi:hypothetical protein